MDHKTESCVKLLLLIQLLVIIIQFILILILCSCDYMAYLNKETCYEAGPEPDTLKITSPPVWQSEGTSLYDGFYFEP